MRDSSTKFIALIFISSVLMVGCATTRPRSAPKPDPASQVAELQSQLQIKDQQIQELQNELESVRQPLTSNFSSTDSKSRSSIIRVPGVSTEDLQRALDRAGFDPGPIDGRAGKKTKSAVKAFQRKNSLTADGIVGEKTWSLLKS